MDTVDVPFVAVVCLPVSKAMAPILEPASSSKIMTTRAGISHFLCLRGSGDGGVGYTDTVGLAGVAGSSRRETGEGLPLTPMVGVLYGSGGKAGVGVDGGGKELARRLRWVGPVVFSS